MAGLSDLDFNPGLEIEKLVALRFKCVVCSPLPALSFLLVASFGRSSVRLNKDSVSLLLQSCLWGSAKDFRVAHLSGWMFQFSVSCKNVGLLVYKLKSFSCKVFSIFFFLWGNGGPNWIKDYNAWCLEQDAKWTLVGPNGKAAHSIGKKSYVEIVKSQSLSLSKKLVFRCLS